MGKYKDTKKGSKGVKWVSRMTVSKASKGKVK